MHRHVVTSPPRLPDPAWVGVFPAGAAIVMLFRPRTRCRRAPWGGALGGMLTAMTEVQGLHSAAALAAVVGARRETVWLARVRRVCARVLRDEALLGVCLLGLVVAVVPGVIDGWQAAVNLTIPARHARPGHGRFPAWTLALVGTAMALGAMYSLWSRR